MDADDRAIGTASKLEAHEDGGRLHRAFSVFLFDEHGRVLLQQRARTKYHFALLWTNACCGHPGPDEDVVDAARRRVQQELGVDASIAPAFAFRYEASDPASGLTEREYDHVLTGVLDATLDPNPDEVEAVDWWEPDALLADVAARPGRYTPWFRQAVAELERRGLLAST